MTQTLARRGAIASAEFLPRDIAGLIAWWRADTLGLADAAAVASWPDSSGNAWTLTQGTGANQPTHRLVSTPNGGPAVDFDGTNDEMVTAAVAKPTTAAAYMAVVKLDLIDTTTRMLVAHLASTTWALGGDRVYVRLQNFPPWRWTFGAGPNTKLDAPEETSTSWQIMTFNWTGTELQIWRNGTQVIAATAGSTALSSTTQPICVGGTPGSVQPFHGQIAELAYWNTGLTSTQVQQLTSSWKTAYGIA